MRSNPRRTYHRTARRAGHARCLEVAAGEQATRRSNTLRKRRPRCSPPEAQAPARGHRSPPRSVTCRHARLAVHVRFLPWARRNVMRSDLAQGGLPRSGLDVSALACDRLPRQLLLLLRQQHHTPSSHFRLRPERLRRDAAGAVSNGTCIVSPLSSKSPAATALSTETRAEDLRGCSRPRVPGG